MSRIVRYFRGFSVSASALFNPAEKKMPGSAPRFDVVDYDLDEIIDCVRRNGYVVVPKDQVFEGRARSDYPLPFHMMSAEHRAGPLQSAPQQHSSAPAQKGAGLSCIEVAATMFSAWWLIKPTDKQLRALYDQEK